MTSAEILEWVMGWPWPIIIAFAILIAVGIERIISWDKQDLHENKSSSPIRNDECVCQCE